MKRKLLSIFICLVMVLSVLPISVFAEENEGITYVDRSWDGEKVVERTMTVSNYITVDSNTTAFEDGKWYVVSGKVTVSGRINVSGTANLILCDGCTLNANSGIRLFEGNALNIYGQSADSGKLNAKASYVGNSGIGGNQNDGNGGDLTVYGGSIYASGMVNAAGIGGG